MSVMVKPEIAVGCIGILSKVYKAGMAMFEDIIYQLLQYPKNQEFLFHLQAGAVIMKTNTCI